MTNNFNALSTMPKGAISNLIARFLLTRLKCKEIHNGFPQCITKHYCFEFYNGQLINLSKKEKIYI